MEHNKLSDRIKSALDDICDDICEKHPGLSWNGDIRIAIRDSAAVLVEFIDFKLEGKTQINK